MKRVSFVFAAIALFAGAHALQGEGPKPFSRVLSASFGANHSVVSRSAFIETVMDGKLTKSQLESHLQQRALIHDAVHRVLVAADPTLALPYGEAQKNVLVLLFGDLIGMGSDWPTPAQAWPLTKGFVEEIQASAKEGPYFALGVMHVYYGGITNGGRDIGAMIADETKVAQNYYLKSDGYREYLKKVDVITDPKAQREMIRGGQAAYRYIIAFNNETAFKGK